MVLWGTSRRRFLTAAGSVALIPPLVRVTRAQSSLPVVGFVNAESASSGYAHMAVLFKDGLKEAGFVDGQNVTIEYHWAEGDNDRLPAILNDLIQRRVAVIAATTTPAALVAKA